MKQIIISDVTMKNNDSAKDFELSFKEKIDIAGILDKLNVPVIEIHGIEHAQSDTLLLKSLSTTVKNGILAVPVELNAESVSAAAEALKEARRFRLQVQAPVSPVQMEYLSHKKPDAMLAAVNETVSLCKQYTGDVEFLAFDATRAETDFLLKAVQVAVKAGASTVTVCDTAGELLPDEFTVFLQTVRNELPHEVKLGVSCSNQLTLADSCSVAAIKAGVDEIKTAVCGGSCASLTAIAGILDKKKDSLNAETTIRQTELQRGARRITDICTTFRSKKSPFDNGVRDDEPKIAALNSHDELPAVLAAVRKLGYDLSEEDGAVVYEAFSRIAAKKESVSSKELEAIVASAAMQVPPTYRVESYVINTGNIITSTTHIKLWKGDKLLEGISTGDGPVDSSFLAIEQITGHHYELDDFQIQAVTEGREAMGETIVKLRDGGRLYSGRGISTDIIGSSIRAYVNALNKIVYEED